MGADDKKNREGKQERGCCRLGMPRKRSAASSTLRLDKLWERVAWINPPLSYLLRCQAFHIWVHKWGFGGAEIVGLRANGPVTAERRDIQ